MDKYPSAGRSHRRLEARLRPHSDDAGRIPDIRAVMAGEPLALEGMAAFFPENNYACSLIDRRLAELIATVMAAWNGARFGGSDSIGDRLSCPLFAY